jgi:hypothetical protein
MDPFAPAKKPENVKFHPEELTVPDHLPDVGSDPNNGKVVTETTSIEVTSMPSNKLYPADVIPGGI